MANHDFQPTRRRAIGMLGASALLPQAVHAAGLEALTGTAFGTEWRIIGAPGTAIAQMRSSLEALFDDIDYRFSPWRADSLISRFNTDAAYARANDAALIELATAALQIADKSEGAFDPTVGPLVARWGFGPIETGGQPDWRGLQIGSEGIRKTRGDLTLDLCGIAKGWALDMAGAHLRSAGGAGLLIEVGGEFLALGHHPDGRDWRIAVESPLETLPAATTLRMPAGVAVATSGTRRQSFSLNERLYSHIIDPRTQEPVAGAMRSVTVVAATATEADGWATALCAAGDTAGPQFAADNDIAALFLFEIDGELRSVRTGQFNDFEI